MKFILIGDANGRRILADGWRIPREDVQTFTQAAELLQHAEHIERATVKDAEAARRQASAEGFQEGRVRGLAHTERALQAALAAYKDQLDDLERNFGERLGAVALDIVRKLTGGEEGGQLVAAAARAAAHEIMAEQPSVVRVHADSLSAVRTAMAEVSPQIQVRSFEGAARDSCIFETKGGEVDASISLQLGALADALGAAQIREGGSQ